MVASAFLLAVDPHVNATHISFSPARISLYLSQLLLSLSSIDAHGSMSSSSPRNPLHPPDSFSQAMPPHLLSDPLPSHSNPVGHSHHVSADSHFPGSNTQPNYPPPPDVFHTHSTPQVSMPPPTQRSHLISPPTASLPTHSNNLVQANHRDQPSSFQNYSIPRGPLTAPPPLPPDHVRLLKPVTYPQALISRIAHLETQIRNSPFLSEILSDVTRRTSNSATGVDFDHFAGRKSHSNTLIDYGYPRNDVDADYCLEDTPGLSTQNFNLLKETLNSHLHRCRRSAQETVSDLEASVASQTLFRVVPAAELERRIQHIVSRFCEARQQILHKFRGYVRNRRWIENVATRQRRGCLTHRQNNILRMWLFSHFSNPYPNADDKRSLTAETQLSMTQINNWLINARSRVWKPTVENMSGERIRKQTRKKEEARASGKRRDREPTDPSTSQSNDGRRETHDNVGENQMSRDPTSSLPANSSPDMEVTMHNISLGIPGVSTGVPISSALADSSSSVVPGVGSSSANQNEGLADVGGTWLVPQSFETLDFNTEGGHQHSA